MDNSKSLFRDMIQSALDCDLNKTELQVFLVLLSHTLGFGKASDPLSYGRIAQHMHKRKDHVKQSARRVVDTGLFNAAKHKSFDFTYTIGAKFLVNHRGDFFTPTLPKTGEGFRKMVAFSENWEHTNNYPYNSLSLHPQTTVEQPMTVPIANHVVEPTHDCCGCKNKNSLETVANTIPPVSTEEVAQEHLTSESSLEDCANKPPSCLDWDNAALPTLPDIIPKQGAHKIYNIFKRGTPEQAHNALLVFADIQKKEPILNPIGLMRRLAEWSQDGTLTLPNTETSYRPQPYSAAHISHNPNPNAGKTPAQITQSKLAGEIAYLHRIAALSPDESIENVAQDAGIEHVLAYIDH